MCLRISYRFTSFRLLYKHQKAHFLFLFALHQTPAVTPVTSNGAAPAQGAFPDRPLTPRPTSTSAQATPTLSTAHSNQSTSALSQQEVSFQFDRHVQEIRRRRTVAKRAPPPDRDDFTRVEAESGKRVLDVGLYVQAVSAFQTRSRFFFAVVTCLFWTCMTT